MAGTRGNVLAGKANWYYAPIGTTVPTETVAFGGSWPAGWIGSYYTDDGVSIEEDKNIEEMRVEEEANPVRVYLDSRTITVGLNIAEDTMEATRLSFGGGTITTTAAGIGIIGKDELVLSDTLDEMMLGVEGLNPEGFFRRFIFPVVVSVGNFGKTYRRAQKRITPVTFRYLGETDDITIVSKKANATA